MSGGMGMMGDMMPPYMPPEAEAEMEAYMESMAGSGYMDEIMSDPEYMEAMAESGYMGAMDAPDYMESMAMSRSIGLMGLPGGGGSADQLETFLVSELARDNYEKAMDFAHSRKSDSLKLTCLINIAQSLGNPGY